MAYQVQYPQQGADLLCGDASLFTPLTILEVQTHLETMQQIVGQCGHLPIEYNAFFYRVKAAWEFYRPSQPSEFRAQLDLVLSEIMGVMLID